MGDQGAELSALDFGSSLADFDGMAGTLRFNDGAVEFEAASTAVDGAASDNAAGAHPAVLDALVRANDGHALAYGDDRWTAEAVGRFRQQQRAI